MSLPAKRFRIAFSFAGEKRAFVAEVAGILAERFGKDRILYDKFYEAEFANADLGIDLPDLYYKESDLVVVVICKDYLKKEWPGLEWRAIHALIKERKGKDVMLCRFDHAAIKGLYSTAGFVELDDKTPAQTAKLILQRLKANGIDTKKRTPSRQSAAPASHAISTPHNLPRLPSFFGRTEELKKIADALSPKTRTWGALIDGPGGIGKTSLAIRAAELSAGLFQRIFFLTSKGRELTAEGEVKRTDFVLPGYLAMLNEIARLLKQPDLAKQPEEERARLLIEALAPSQALLILDNLESLAKDDQNRLFEFLSQLPPGCKAIVTSRRRTDVDARIIRLAKLDRDAALELIAELATDRPLLAKAGAVERDHLYEETGGNPLLLRWIAGQLGKGRCRTVAKALDFLRSAPEDNDPLEFIFGDLLETFTDSETAALAALTYYTREVEVKLIAELAGLSKTAAEAALGDLSSRALVVPDEEEKNFALVPMVADFLRRKRPAAVAESGQRLEERAQKLIMENGGEHYDRFPILDAAWLKVLPALPIFLAGSNRRLESVCAKLQRFLDFTGRWDEWLSFNLQAEVAFVAAGDHGNAGWRVCHAGHIYCLREEADAALTCANRAAAHWETSNAEARERAAAINLRGRALALKQDYAAAIAAYREALDLNRSLSADSADVATGLNNLATAEQSYGDLAGAERDYREALRVAHVADFDEGVATFTGNLAALAVRRKEWLLAEPLAREALSLAEKLGRQELIASNCYRLAKALLRQSKPAEGLSHARRAMTIFTRLGWPDLKFASSALAECRASLLDGLHVGWIYNTTTLEGGTLTEAEVAEALATPKAKIAKRPAEHVAAVRAQQAAIQALGRWLGEDRPFTTDDLFSLHTVLMQGSTVDSMKPIGAWKIEDNGTPIRPGGKSRWNDNYATAQHTGALMETWLTEFNKRREGAGEPFEDYLWLHATFVRIHPFADGNGRLARLLANVPLVASGQPVVDIPATARDRYLAALARWQFACGAPRPNAPLYSKAGELKDFIALCKASQATARNPAADGTPRRKPKAPRRRKSPPR
jgi:Fic family protein